MSTNNYWSAREFARRGHGVHLATNAFEVEPAFRMELRPDDATWLEPSFEETGGFVKVYPTRGMQQMRLGHIPQANPFVTKLASVATQVIRTHDCEAIYAFYLEPYAVAGHLASMWTGRPLIIKHAGSDIGRLMRNPSISASYKEVLQSAAMILTSEGLADRFASVGVNANNIFPAPVCPTPPVFSPEPDADAQDILSRVQPLKPATSSALDLTKPTIGIYGKVGVLKGSLDLIHALARLRRQGLDFNFLAMTQGDGLHNFKDVAREAGLGDCTWMIPFVPNWRVPRFIRTCTAVCFLERDFPIKHHGPRIPREVLACGTCLVLSDEIARKQPYRSSLSHGENVLLVDDPKDIGDLAAALKTVIEAPERADDIGECGYHLSRKVEQYQDFAEQLEDLMLRATGQPSTARSFEERAREQHGSAPDTGHAGPFLTFLSPMIPWADLFADDSFREAVRRFSHRDNNASPPDPASALRFVQYLKEELQTQRLNSQEPIIEEILRFEQARLRVKWGLDVDAPDALSSLKVSLYLNGNGDQKTPRLKYGTLVESFRHRVTPLFREDERPDDGDIAARFHRLTQDMKPGNYGVIFQRLPNGGSRVFTVGAATRDLVTRCDGRQEVEAIIEETSSAYGLHGESGAELRGRLRSILESLEDRDVIAIEA